jgi:hypothetical protein
MGHDHVKNSIDIGALAGLVGVLTGLLPIITTWISFVWVCIRLYETKTMQRLIHGKQDDTTNSSL